MSAELVPASAVELLTPEAQRAFDARAKMRAGLNSYWEGLAEIVEIEGWREFGYRSFRRWMVDEFAMSLGSADEHFRKTKRLMEMSKSLNQTIAELAPQVAQRNLARRPQSAAYISMRRSMARLRSVPHLTDPMERKAAAELRDHLNRLLED